jgi:hypothetical protein
MLLHMERFTVTRVTSSRVKRTAVAVEGNSVGRRGMFDVSPAERAVDIALRASRIIFRLYQPFPRACLWRLSPALKGVCMVSVWGGDMEDVIHASALQIYLACQGVAHQLCSL